MDFEEKEEKVYKAPVANNKVKVDAGVLERAPVFGVKSVEHHEESVADRRKRWAGKLHEQFAKEQDYEVEDECYDVFASQEIVDLAANPKYKVRILTLKWNPNVYDGNDLRKTFLSSLRDVVSKKDRNPNLRLCVLCGAGLMDKWEEPHGIVVEVQPGRNAMERKWGGNLLVTFKDKEPEVAPEKPKDKEKEKVAERRYSFKVDDCYVLQDENLISDLKGGVLSGKSFMDALLQFNEKAGDDKTEIIDFFESLHGGKPSVNLSADDMARGKGMVFIVPWEIDDKRFWIKKDDSKRGDAWVVFVPDEDGGISLKQSDFCKEFSFILQVDKTGSFDWDNTLLVPTLLSESYWDGSEFVNFLRKYNSDARSAGKVVCKRVNLTGSDGKPLFDLTSLKSEDVRGISGVEFYTQDKTFKEKCEKDGLRIVGTKTAGEWKISVPQKTTVEPSDRSEEEEEEEEGANAERLEELLKDSDAYKAYSENPENLEKFDFRMVGKDKECGFEDLLLMPDELLKAFKFFIIPGLPEDADRDLRDARQRFVKHLIVSGWYFCAEAIEIDGERVTSDSPIEDAMNGKVFTVRYTGGTTKCVLTPYLTGLVYSNEDIYKDLGEKADDYIYKLGEYEMQLQCRQTESKLRLPLIFAYEYTNDPDEIGLKDEQYVTDRLRLEDAPEAVREKIENLVGEGNKEDIEVLDAVCFYRKGLYTGKQGEGSRNYFLHPWLTDKMFQSSRGVLGRGDNKCDRLIPGTTFVYDVNGEDISANKESEAQKNAGIRALDGTFGKPYRFSYHGAPGGVFDYAMSSDNCWFRIEKPDAKAWFVSFYDPDSNVAGKNDRNQEFNKKKKCIAIRWTFKLLQTDDGSKDTPEAESYQMANKIPALIPQFSEKEVTEEARENAGKYMALFHGWQAAEELKRQFAEEKKEHTVSVEQFAILGDGFADCCLKGRECKVRSLRLQGFDADNAWRVFESVHRVVNRGECYVEDINVVTDLDLRSFCAKVNSTLEHGCAAVVPVNEAEKVVRFAGMDEWIKWLSDHPLEKEESGENDEVIEEEEEKKWANAERLEALLKDSDAYKVYLEDPVNLREFDFRRTRGIDPELLLKMPDKLLKGFSYFIIPGLPKNADGDLLGIEERKCFVERLILKGWKFNGACIKIAERGGGDKGLDPIFYVPDCPIEEAMNGEMFTVQYTGGTTKCILTPYLTGLCYSKDEIFKALGEKQEDFIKADARWRFAWGGMSNISRPLIFAYDAVNDGVRADDLQYISDCMYYGVLPDGVKAEIGDFFGQKEGKISKLSGEELQVLDAVCFYDDKLYANKDKPGTRNYFLHTWLIDKMFRSSIIGSDKCDTIVKDNSDMSWLYGTLGGGNPI